MFRPPQFIARLLLTVILPLRVAVSVLSAEEDPGPFPSRPIKVIVPFAAGGGSDTFVRVIQQAVKDENLLPQPLVVINRPGAGGTIGSQEATNAAPDGYTILNLHQGILTAKYSGKVDHGPEAFEPITATGEDAMLLAVADDSSFRSLKDLLDEAAARPDTLAYGANLGAPSHFSALLLEHAKPGARFRFVQTGGGATRFADLTGGHIGMTTFSVAEYLRFRSGGVRALAFLGPKRHPALPETPTAREQGFDVVTSNLQFWWAPKGTPADRIKVLADALEQAMNTPFVREKLAAMSVEPVVLRGESLRRAIAERELDTAKVGVRKLDSLPDLPASVAALVAILAAAVSWSEWKRRKRSTTPLAAAGGPHSAPKSNAIACVALVLAYVAALNLRLLPFPILTALFIFTTGWRLERAETRATSDTSEPSHSDARHAAALAALALIVGFGSHALFTRVLTVDLP